MSDKVNGERVIYLAMDGVSRYDGIIDFVRAADHVDIELIDAKLSLRRIPIVKTLADLKPGHCVRADA